MGLSSLRLAVAYWQVIDCHKMRKKLNVKNVDDGRDADYQLAVNSTDYLHLLHF